MASINVTLSDHIENCFYDAEAEGNSSAKVQEFLDKWGEEVPFFSFSKHGEFGWSEELVSLDLDDYEYDNFLLSFMGSDVKDALPFSFGEGEYEDEFYSDLFNLVGDKLSLGMRIEESNTRGYWSGGFFLTKDGLEWELDFYEDNEDEDW